jgi:hypothetical protein
MEANIEIILGTLALVAVVLVVAFVLLRKRSADRLRSRFGPEYPRAVEEAGGTQKAEAQLHKREKRVHGFTIRTLTPSERERYLLAWRDNQAQFIDDPKLSVVSADQLLSELVGDRGYPVGDFEQRSADLSVNHPVLVQNYRTAYEIATRQDQANTEDLRQAMLGYRAFFDVLVGESLSGEAEDSAEISDRIPEADAVTPPQRNSQEATEAELTANPATMPAGARAVEDAH